MTKLQAFGSRIAMHYDPRETLGELAPLAAALCASSRSSMGYRIHT